MYSEQGVMMGITQQFPSPQTHRSSQYEENVAMFKHVQNTPVSQVSSSTDSGYVHETRPSPGKDSAVSGMSRESTPGRDHTQAHASYPPRVLGQPHVVRTWEKEKLLIEAEYESSFFSSFIIYIYIYRLVEE